MSETYLELTRLCMRGSSRKLGIETADTLFVNGTIWTGDARQPWAQSMAVANGRILSLSVGSAKVGACSGILYYCFAVLLCTGLSPLLHM